MAKENVIEKFNMFFTKLNQTEQRHLYDLLSMLRGPDLGDDKDTVKIATTCRIRAMLGVQGCNFASATPRNTSPMIENQPIDVTTVRSQLTVFKDSNSHFVWHAEDALQTLTELGILKETTETS